MTGLITSVSRVFIEYPEMRKFFYEGVKPSGTDYDRARSIAVTVADAIDHVAEHLDRMSGPAAEAWKAYFRDIYESSPVLKEYLQTHSSWYGPVLRELLGIG